MKSIRKGLAEILTVLLVIGLLPVSPGRSVSYAAAGDTASESDALGDGLVLNPEIGTDSDAVPDAEIGTASDASFDRTVTVSGYTIRVTAEAGVFPEGSTLIASEITDSGKKETINEKVSEEAGKETAALISFDIKVLDRSGNEVEPDLTKGKPVVTFGKVNAEQLAGKKDAKLEVYHLDDDLNTAEKLKAEENKTKETVKAEAEHFSVFTLAGGTGSTYTVEFSGNAPTSDYIVTGSMTSQSIEVGVQTALNANEYSCTRNGVQCNFTGWNTQQGGKGTPYKNGEEVTDLVAANGSITLYAQWTPQTGNNWYIQGRELHIGADSTPADASYSGNIVASKWTGLEDAVKNTITKVIVEKTCIAPTSTQEWFNGFSNLTSCDLSSLDTGSVKKMGGMFSGCSGLQSLDLSKFDTSNVTTMSGMFYGCSNLKSLDLSGFNTANVTSMYSMFDRCSGLQSLDLSNFNTSNVTYMTDMFYNCSSLKSLDLSNFNTSNVTYMDFMFYGCSSLQSLNLSSFNTANVSLMANMFSNCSSLISVTFGQNFTFKDYAVLPTPSGTIYTGDWVRKLDNTKCTSAELATRTGTKLAGIWEADFHIS